MLLISYASKPLLGEQEIYSRILNFAPSPYHSDREVLDKEVLGKRENTFHVFRGALF